MTACAAAAPLRVPIQYDPSFKVDTRLHEPIWVTNTFGEDVHMDILTVCAQIDFLCNKELSKHASKRISHGQVSNEFEAKAMVLLDKLENLSKKLPSSQQNLEDYLEYSGLASLYPRAAAYVIRPNDLSLTQKKTAMDGYFQQMTSLQQLVTMAHQLNSDVQTLNNHKYIAHQVALLYQCILSLGKNASCLFEFKENIESNFKLIKKSLSTDFDDDSVPRLTEPHQQWLLQLTSDIAKKVSSFPTDITYDVFPAASYIQRI